METPLLKVKIIHSVYGGVRVGTEAEGRKIPGGYEVDLVESYTENIGGADKRRKATLFFSDDEIEIIQRDIIPFGGIKHLQEMHQEVEEEGGS